MTRVTNTETRPCMWVNWVRPNGTRTEHEYEMPVEAADVYDAAVEAGFEYALERLNEHDVALYISDNEIGFDPALDIVPSFDGEEARNKHLAAFILRNPLSRLNEKREGYIAEHYSRRDK